MQRWWTDPKQDLELTCTAAAVQVTMQLEFSEARVLFDRSLRVARSGKSHILAPQDVGKAKPKKGTQDASRGEAQGNGFVKPTIGNSRIGKNFEHPDRGKRCDAMHFPRR